MLRYSVLVEPGEMDGVYVAAAPALPGIVAQEATVDEALGLVTGAIELGLEGMLVDGDVIPVERETSILRTVEVAEPVSVWPRCLGSSRSR
jgi:predicted RNase H-like HicB family nuclease